MQKTLLSDLAKDLSKDAKNTHALSAALRALARAPNDAQCEQRARAQLAAWQLQKRD